MSHVVVGLLFACIAVLVGFDWQRIPPAVVVWLGANLVALAASAAMDSHRNNRGR